jgi:hypothetical protein
MNIRAMNIRAMNIRAMNMTGRPAPGPRTGRAPLRPKPEGSGARARAWHGPAVWVCILAAALSVACNRRTAPYTAEEPARDRRPVRIPMLATPQPSVAPRAVPGPTGRPAASAQAARAPADTAEPSVEAVRGTIRLAPGVALPERGVLFLFARSATPGPPVAAKQIPPQDFPIAFTLGPEDSMGTPGPFEGPMTILARLDMDGNASTTTPGDLAGAAPGAVMPGQTGLEIVLAPTDR